MTDSTNRPVASRLIAAALLRQGNRYLFIKQNKEGGAYPDRLHIPGGGVDVGETPLEAVQREVLEEVGIELDDFLPVDFAWDTLMYKGAMTVLVFCRFVADIPEGVEPRPSSDAEEIVWLEQEALLTGNHNSSTLSLFRTLNLVPE
ncbi:MULTISPECIES: NUDIX hydrolase [unclassified Mameliella]|uniref:NUDIX hydrolase n=1 Tax=unclassified Mameliella TaxID=2630630 RepID=UPI00273E42B9|nr:MULTISPECIES: NUDIX hydrolase [unclassified Mameliella]